MGWNTSSAPSLAGRILALALLTVTGIGNAAPAPVGIQPSLSVDVTGAARVAFFDLFHGDLEFAIRSPITGAWTVQVVDPRGGRGIHPSLSDSTTLLGGSGEPAVAYYDQGNGDLVYAKRSGGVWQSLTVDAVGDVGSFCSLQYSPPIPPTTAANPAIAYFDATNGDLKFASWNGAGWTIETVDATGIVGQHCSLAFDPISQAPVIAYYDATNTALKLATKGPSSWAVETVDSPGVGEYCSLSFEGSRGPRISYFDAGHGALKFAGKSAGVWTVETVDPSPGVGRYTSLRINDFRVARIAYYDATNGDLKLATRNLSVTAGPWSVETLAAAGDVGRFASLALDPRGDPQVCAYDVNNGALLLAAYSSGAWAFESVDAQNRTGRFGSLAIDAQGSAHVAFFDAIHGHLVYAQRASGGWSFATPDSDDQSGQYVSLALDAGGQPAMSYYVATTGELRFAARVGGAWTTEVVDATGIAGMFSSLVLRGGTPAIAYFDARNEALIYATRTGGGWTRETVDAGPGVGLYASLALDGAGNPSIAYFDAVRADLKLARKSGGAWSIETVDAQGNVGQYASLALTSGGVPNIGYHDETGFEPRYAVKLGTWSVEAVDAAGVGGRHTSLVLDGAGRPHMAYYADAQSSLRYAERNGGWTTPAETADNAGNVGRFASLALDPGGAPRVLYYDVTNHAFKYGARDAAGGWSAVGVDGEFPRLRVWTYPGAFQDQTPYFAGSCPGLLPPRPDSLRNQARTITVRFLRDRRAEARSDFGGYRIYRVTQNPDTAHMELIRRYSRQRGDYLSWFMSVVDTTDPALAFRCGRELAHDSIATFVDPDSNGHYEKFCPLVINNRCAKDSVFRLVAPAGPHDGIATYYAITIEARNSGAAATFEDLYVPGRDPDTRHNCELCTIGGRCVPDSCPRLNLNDKALNLTPTGGQRRVEPTTGPMPDLETILVVPNPYRANEVWDQPGAHEVHFVHLPQKATIKIFTVAGDLVAQLEHNDPVRDFEPWNLKNGKGSDVASGIYIYRVESPKCETCVPPLTVAFSLQSRMVVIR